LNGVGGVIGGGVAWGGRSIVSLFERSSS